MRQEDLTVVVQGPISRSPQGSSQPGATERCLLSIRKHLPKSRIVLSTWKGEDASHLTYDALVLSEDPGATVYVDEGQLTNNVNRQIRSTVEGLKVTSTDYCMKLRTDMELTSARSISLFGRFSARSRYTFVSDRIVGSTVYAKNPRAAFDPHVFHPGDCFFLGRTVDMIDLWSSPPTDEPGFSRWYEFRQLEKPIHEAHSHMRPRLYRMTPEQYIWTSFLKQHITLTFSEWREWSEEDVLLTEESFASNLVLYSPRQLGIRFLKWRVPRDCWTSCIYSHAEWVRLYKRYCDPSIRVPYDTEALARTIVRRARIPRSLERPYRAWKWRAWRLSEILLHAFSKRRST